MSKETFSLPATTDTVNAAILTRARVAVVHTISNGETRLRTGVLADTREVGRFPRTYIIIEDEIKGTRGIYLDAIKGDIRFI